MNSLGGYGANGIPDVHGVLACFYASYKQYKISDSEVLYMFHGIHVSYR